MNNWKETKLQEILKFGNGKIKPDIEGNIPIYGGNGILGYCNDFNYSGETIIIGRVGAYCGSVYYENKPIWVSDNALSAKPKDENNTKFLYYFLKYVDLNQWAGGSSHPLVTQTLLNSLEFSICINPKIQTAIASILSSLDDKIDLLHRQNSTLEKMAETLFRQWFVEEAKEEWEVIKLGDLVETTSGYNHKQDDITENGDLLLSMGSIIKQYGIKDEVTRRIKKTEIDKRYICNVGNIILTTRDVTQNAELLGSPGIIPSFFKNRKIIVGSNLYKLTFTSNKVNKWAIYELLKSHLYRDYVKEVASGTSILMLKKSDLDLFQFQIPPVDLISLYETRLSEIYSKVDLNYSSIKTLSNMRDILLPKLMSGEVRVEY